MSSEDSEEREMTEEVFDEAVINFYKQAAGIANRVMATLVKGCAPGALISVLCKQGDDLIEDECGKMFKSKKSMKKGVAFPTSISVNNLAGHFSPLEGDKAALKEGDLFKVDLGVHLNGYVSVFAHTGVVVSAETAKVAIKGEKADVICAAYFASQAALKLCQPGRKSSEITDNIAKICKVFKCEPLEDVLSHRLSKFVIDGDDVIANRANLEKPVPEFTFAENQVYAIDVVVSTGKGKTSESMAARTTIYKKTEKKLQLKIKTARQIYTEVNKKFPTFPFNIRNFSDVRKAKLGVGQCVKNGLVTPYPVMEERSTELVAQFKFTVLISKNNTQQLNTHPLPFVASDLKIEDPEINKLLQSKTNRRRKRKKKAAKAKNEEGKSEAGEKDAKTETKPEEKAD